MPGCWCVGGARDTGPRRGLAAFSPGGPSSLLPAAGGSWCSYDCAWVTSAKTLFPKIVTFIGPGGVKVGLRLFPRHSLAPADLLLNLRHLTLSSQGAEHVPRQEDGGFRPSRNSVLCPCFPRVLGPEASFCADRLDQGEGSSVGVGKCKEKGRNAGCAQSRSSSAPAAAVPPPPSAGVAHERQHTWVAFLGHGGSWVSHQGRRTCRDAGATRNHILRPAHNLLLT